MEKAIPVLNCSLKSSDPAKVKMTVGDPLVMNCLGLIEKSFPENSVLEFKDPAGKYSLSIIKVIKSDTSEFTADVTSYKPGNYNGDGIFLVAGDMKAELKGLQWSYESILKEAEELQKETVVPTPEKFGPFPFIGPVGIQYPIWFWVLLGLMISAVFFSLFKVIKKRNQKKRLIEQALSGMGSALSPLQDFSKIQRQIFTRLGNDQKDFDESMQMIEKGFRSYLVRSYLVPAFDWSDIDVVREIKKTNPKAFEVAGKDVLKILRELNRIKGVNPKKDEVEQLLDLSRRAVEALESENHNLRSNYKRSTL